IMLLDETSALANKRELFLRQVRLEAMEARILAEYRQEARLDFSPHLEALRADFDVASMLDAQTVIFNAASQQLRNDITLLTQSIEALKVRATGYEQQAVAARTQLAILREDFQSKE